MSSNIDCGSTMDSFEISMKLSDSIYNEEDNQYRMEEDAIPDYVFPQESENNFNEIISSGNLYNSQNYYENNNYTEDVNMICLNSNFNENSSSSSSSKISNKKKRSSLSSNASEGGAFKIRHGLTSEDDIPEEVTLSGDYGITYRYIAEFSIYNNKLSRMMPLDCLPNKFESIYFMNEEGTLDSFVKLPDSELNGDTSNGGTTDKPGDEQSCEELTLVGTLIPYEYILNYEKEKTNILKDNFRKLQRIRQKGGGSYKPKKIKEMPKSILKQGELKTFQITCKIHSWTIEFGGNLFDSPYIWVNSMSGNGSSKTCYRLCWPANKYTKLFSSAKIKFEVISRLIKTLLSPNSNRIGYKTFLDQVTGKVVDKSTSKPVNKQQTEEQTSEQIPEMNLEPTSETSSPTKKTNKDTNSVGDQSTTAWGEPVFVAGLSEKDVLLMFPFIEFYLQTYSKKYNLSKTLGLQIITSMKNKITKMILSEDPTLDESYISSNIKSLLQNNELSEKIFTNNKLQTSSVACIATATNQKRRRSSVNKGEDSLKFALIKFKDFTDSFETCQKILKISDFCHSFGDFLELPIHSSSLLSIQSFHSKSFTLDKSKCISQEILNQVYLEFNKVVSKLREERVSGFISQEGLCSLIKIIQVFPQNTLFSTIKCLVNAISEIIFNSKKNNSEDSNQIGKSNPSIKRSYSSFRNESEQSDSDYDSKNFEAKLKLLDTLSVTKSSVDCVSWPVILDMVLAKMNESSMNELGDYLDESAFDDYNSGEQLIMAGETKIESGDVTPNQKSPVQLKKQDKNNSFCTLNNESFFEILNWSVDTLGNGKLGKEFIDNVYNSQKKKMNIGRNDNLIGVDRFSNKYFLFNNINTQNTLYKSVLIVSSCMETLNNKYISHSTPCNNPLCTLSAEGNSPYNLISTPEVAEIQNFLRLNSTLGSNSSKPVLKSTEPNYKFLSKKKEIESLINSLCEDHFCEFQLKLKLKSTFNGKEFEHEAFNSSKYVQECIGNNKPVFIPFNMSLIRIDQEKQFFYFSVLNIIKEISTIYLKVTFPMVVCTINDSQTHFSILDKISTLSTQIFDQFIKGVDVTYYSSQETFKQITILIKKVCETTMDSLEAFGIQLDKQASQKHSLWIRELEALGGINPPEGETQIHLGDIIESSFNKRISVIGAYLKIWMQSIAPSDLITISTGGSTSYGLSGLNQDSILTSSSGFIYSKEEFMSIIGKSYEKQLEYLDKQIPNQMDQFYYFKSGHFLVNLCWMNSILTKNRKANGAMLRLIEQFTEIPPHMANIEKIKVINICYNVGNLANLNQPADLDSNNTQEDNEATVYPFILINCQVTPRKNSSCTDELVELVDNLKESFENIQHLNIEHFSRKRTSNRIKNNNLSNSYRDAMIADSTFTIAESRETFIKKNLSYDQESQNETRYISLILPISLSAQNNALPVGRLSHLQRRSFEIFNFRPTTPFYIIKEDLVKSSIKEITEKSSFKVSYNLGEKIHSGVIRRIIIEDYDIWDCMIVESDDSKKNKDCILVCLNLWQIIPN